MRALYKLLTEQEFTLFRQQGVFRGSAADLKDGFIHFSYADQATETARKHFAGQENLVLLAVSPARLMAQLKDEISRNGALFPHLYGEFIDRDVMWSKKIALNETGVPVLGALADSLAQTYDVAPPAQDSAAGA